MNRWLVRAASAAALVQGLAHGATVLLVPPSHGPVEAQVVAVMKNHLFDFSGFERSYWDLYTGYALLAAGTCLVEAALLFILSTPDVEEVTLRKVALLVIAANLLHAIAVLRFFFPAPLFGDGLVVTLLTVAVVPTVRRYAQRRQATS